MKAVTINTQTSSFTINFPTSLNEITTDYLTEVTNEIEVGLEHSLVAIIYREKLVNILNSSKKNTPLTCAVVPKFIKSGDTSSEFIKRLKINDTLIITGSDLARGIHVNCSNNELSIGNICELCKLDSNSYRIAITLDEYLYFVEFKLVPNCDIHGKVTPPVERISKYITRKDKVNNVIGEA